VASSNLGSNISDPSNFAFHVKGVSISIRAKNNWILRNDRNVNNPITRKHYTSSSPARRYLKTSAHRSPFHTHGRRQRSILQIMQRILDPFLLHQQVMEGSDKELVLNQHSNFPQRIFLDLREQHLTRLQIETI
jgi:hypothetical protein